jgi:hypothetical protein
MLEKQELHVDIGSLQLDVQVVVNINVLLWNIEFYQRMQMLMGFQKHGK